MEWVDAYLKHNPLADVFDALLIPAIMAPTSLSRVRYVCGKVQTDLPAARVIAAFLGSTRAANETLAALHGTDIDTVVTTLSDAAALIAKSRD